MKQPKLVALVLTASFAIPVINACQDEMQRNAEIKRIFESHVQVDMPIPHRRDIKISGELLEDLRPYLRGFANRNKLSYVNAYPIHSDPDSEGYSTIVGVSFRGLEPRLRTTFEMLGLSPWRYDTGYTCQIYDIKF